MSAAPLKVEWGWGCDDCGQELAVFANYMVYDRVWKQVFDSYHGVCCLGCLERRLGRELVADDFEPVPINAVIAERLLLLHAGGDVLAVTAQYRAAIDREKASWFQDHTHERQRRYRAWKSQRRRRP